VTPDRAASWPHVVHADADRAGGCEDDANVVVVDVGLEDDADCAAGAL
jgi:hypothetical protein